MEFIKNRKIRNAISFTLFMAMLVFIGFALFVPKPVVEEPLVDALFEESPVASQTGAGELSGADTIEDPGTPAETPVEPPAEVAGAEVTADNITLAVNAERYANGLQPLQRDPKLDAAAQAKLSDMLAKGYFAHLSPEGNDHTFFIEAAGYQHAQVNKAAGENLARQFTTTQDTVAAWMASPTHRRNIVNAVYEETGVATNGNVTVQLFAGEETK